MAAWASVTRSAVVAAGSCRRFAHAPVVVAQHGHAVAGEVVGQLPNMRYSSCRVAVLRARVADQHHGREGALAGGHGERAAQA